jgi:hypothetical protein
VSGIRVALLLCGLTIFLLPSQSFGESYRCPNGEIVTGESTYTDVLSRCGTPFFVDRKMKDYDVIDTLGYKMAGGKLDTGSRRGRTSEIVFTLLNGRLTKIARDTGSD